MSANNEDKRPVVTFRVDDPQDKIEIKVEAAYAGTNASDFIRDAVMKKVKKLRQKRLQTA